MSAPDLDFSELTALFINTTLTRSPATSHTQLLIDASASIMAKQGVRVDGFRSVDHPIASGVYPDMRAGSGTTAARPRKSSSGCMPTPGSSTTAASGSTTDGSAAA